MRNSRKEPWNEPGRWKKRTSPSPERGDWKRQRGGGGGGGGESSSFKTTAEEQKWVDEENLFAQRQARQGALIRVREGRAKPMDWLLLAIPVEGKAERRHLVSEFETAEESGSLNSDQQGIMHARLVDMEFESPSKVLQSLDAPQLKSVAKSIDGILTSMDLDKPTREYWTCVGQVCTSEETRLESKSWDETRVLERVRGPINQILSGKTRQELEKIQQGAEKKLSDKGPGTDTDFWRQLLKEIDIKKAYSVIESTYQACLKIRRELVIQAQKMEAFKAASQIDMAIKNGQRKFSVNVPYRDDMDNALTSFDHAQVVSISDIDKQRQECKEKVDRNQGFMGMGPSGYGSGKIVPLYDPKTSSQAKEEENNNNKQQQHQQQQHHVPATIGQRHNGGSSGGGMVDENENEFAFNDEEVLTSIDEKGQQSGIKPRYFNRVLMGYEWNKYNQTHYDSNNPPPKVVQGYKFNIFYPELANSPKAPTYKIIRTSSANDDDGDEFTTKTCIIRFVAGPPYQDLAFKIVDREWDYSSKRFSGFRSSFDKGVLQLHFRFKRVFYRK